MDIETCADWTKPYHVIVTRDVDKQPAFYSGHDDKASAHALAQDLNKQAADHKNKKVPSGFTYSVRDRSAESYSGCIGTTEEAATLQGTTDVSAALPDATHGSKK